APSSILPACGLPSGGIFETRCNPRKNLVTLSSNAATAVAQGLRYISDLEHGSILQRRESALFLGTSAYVFIIMGLSVELEEMLVSGLLDSNSRSLLPPNFQIIPYDHLYKSFDAGVPPLVMAAVAAGFAQHSIGLADETKLGIFLQPGTEN